MGYFFITLIIVVGYFICVSVAVSMADNKRALSKIAMIVLVAYGCVVGMIAAIGQYLGELGLLLFLLAALYSIFFLAWMIYRIVKTQPRLNIGVLAAFISYIVAVLYLTTFMRDSGSNSQIQMEVLNWAKENGIEDFNHILLNVAMFVPIGVLFPLLSEESRGKVLGGASFGILLSTLIETGQLLLHSGTCDIDDILSNSLGALFGAVISAAVTQSRRRVRRR